LPGPSKPFLPLPLNLSSVFFVYKKGIHAIPCSHGKYLVRKIQQENSKVSWKFKKGKLVEHSALVPIQFKDDLAISVWIFERVFAELPFHFARHFNRQRRWSSPGQLISNGGRLKPAFSERDKKQTMIDLR
jgi:hypothetical protein